MITDIALIDLVSTKTVVEETFRQTLHIMKSFGKLTSLTGSVLITRMESQTHSCQWMEPTWILNNRSFLRREGSHNKLNCPALRPEVGFLAVAGTLFG